MEPKRLDEHRVLIRHLAALQARCTDAIAERDATIKRLEADLMLAQAERIRRDTLIAIKQAQLEEALAAAPDLPDRLALTRQIRQLQSRIDVLTRELNGATHFTASIATSTGASRPARKTLKQRRSFDQDDLDAAITAREVICQTGCISHGHYWLKTEDCALSGHPCSTPPTSGKSAPDEPQASASITRAFARITSED
ncbi:hypothetical protein [Nitrogeniibacter aestuarii]|uniref:hypothetical protein n=1 Tax=Nitrogeniibacter aestuarii TaxID=2815343 RepID=UPI001D0FECAF|nr:hypothetical protein [Nitrogeniibacter aestuarii]